MTKPEGEKEMDMTMSEKTFPILDDRDRNCHTTTTPRAEIPWALIEPHRQRAFDNHDQTLERLSERGGLTPREALCAIENKPLGYVKTMNVVASYDHLMKLASALTTNPKGGEEKANAKKRDADLVVLGKCAEMIETLPTFQRKLVIGYLEARYGKV